MLEGITICGADDGIGPHMLALLGQQYPFIEWGILMSKDRVGTARYPSISWTDRLCKYFEKSRGFGLSAHLCGEFARVTAAGNPAYLDACVNGDHFRRVQINGVSANNIGTYFHRLPRTYANLEFILQTGSDELVKMAAGISLCCRPGRVAALYDPSGGRGIFPGAFPEVPQFADVPFHVGFAGGITPDNVLAVIDRIGSREEPYWICMESGVRTDNEFDIAKVHAVAAKVGEYLAGEMRRRLRLREVCA